VLEYIKFREENPIKGVPAIFGSLGFQEMAVHDEAWHVTAFAWGNARHRRRGFWTEEVEKEWTARGARIEVYPGDVTDTDFMARCANQFALAAGGVDLVLANALTSEFIEILSCLFDVATGCTGLDIDAAIAPMCKIN